MYLSGKKRVNQSLMWVCFSIYNPEISVIVHDAIINDNQMPSLVNKSAWYLIAELVAGYAAGMPL